MQTDSSNFKVDAATYKAICDAVFDCAKNCVRKGQMHYNFIDSVKEEYTNCTDKIFKLLGGVIEQ